MVQKSTSNRTSSPGGLVGLILRITLRVLQIVVALVIAGFYGRDLHTASQRGEGADSRWVYAEVIAAFSIITAGAYLLPFVKAWKVWPWDAVLFIFWVALFGTFGDIYIAKDCKGNGGCNNMKTAVWFDLIGMLLWFISALAGAFMWYKERHSRSMFTGRAAVV